MQRISRESALASVQQEILKEQAGALGRIGALLDDALGRLQAIADEHRVAPDWRRHRLAERHAEVRKEAFELRWFLEVQREAMGLSRHHDLVEQYPIPALG